MPSFRATATACALMLAAVSPAAPATPAPDAGIITACMRDAARQLGFSGVAYARRGEVVADASFGTADASGHVPITRQTRFDIGSAGKMLTALAIAKLVDQGLIRLDAPIAQYLPDLPPAFARITVAQLLDHTSGLGDYFVPGNQRAIESATSVAQLLPLALATPPAFPPGSRRAYSNSGYVVLGAIIEKVSGTPYPAFVQTHLLQPLGMTHTGFAMRDAAVPMTRMSPEGRQPRARPSPFAAVPASRAGGVISTVDDLSRLLSAIDQASIVSRPTLNDFLTPRPDPSAKPGTYGYGFNVEAQPYRRVGHGGGAPGVNAQVALYPDSGWQLIALSNVDPPAAAQMVDVLQEVVHAADPPLACKRALQQLRH